MALRPQSRSSATSIPAKGPTVSKSSRRTARLPVPGEAEFPNVFFLAIGEYALVGFQLREAFRVCHGDPDIAADRAPTFRVAERAANAAPANLGQRCNQHR